jgi:hypothetical protein
VGDLFKVVPQLINEIKAAKAATENFIEEKDKPRKALYVKTNF